MVLENTGSLEMGRGGDHRDRFIVKPTSKRRHSILWSARSAIARFCATFIQVSGHCFIQHKDIFCRGVLGHCKDVFYKQFYETEATGGQLCITITSFIAPIVLGMCTE